MLLNDLPKIEDRTPNVPILFLIVTLIFAEKDLRFGEIFSHVTFIILVLSTLIFFSSSQLSW